MRLVEALKLLKEEQENIIEYEKENIIMSLFPAQKKINLAAFDKAKPALKKLFFQ